MNWDEDRFADVMTCGELHVGYSVVTDFLNIVRSDRTQGTPANRRHRKGLPLSQAGDDELQDLDIAFEVANAL